MTGRGAKGRGRHSPSTSDSSDDDTFTHIQCWIPAANIDLVVLAAYLKEFIDDTATIKTAANPQNPSKPGYQVGARNTLSVPAVQDIIQDSRTWEKEKTNRNWRKDPYSYNESDAWYSRKKKGASPGATKPRQRRRRPEDESAETTTATTDATRTSRPQQTQTAGRHARDPRPESPPRPSNPPPDILKDRERESKIPKPGIETQFRKMSIAGDKDYSRDNLSKKQTYDEPKEEANRGARIQPNTSSTRHRDKMEDDIRSTVTSGRKERERGTIDDDDVRSTTSAGRIRDRHGR